MRIKSIIRTAFVASALCLSGIFLPASAQTNSAAKAPNDLAMFNLKGPVRNLIILHGFYDVDSKRLPPSKMDCEFFQFTKDGFIKYYDEGEYFTTVKTPPFEKIAAMNKDRQGRLESYSRKTVYSDYDDKEFTELVCFKRDAAGMLAEILSVDKDKPQNEISSILLTRTKSGKVTKAEYGNLEEPFTRIYTYDSLGRLMKITEESETGGSYITTIRYKTRKDSHGNYVYRTQGKNTLTYIITYY